MKLANALLRRKELALKVAQIAQIKPQQLFEIKVQRKPVMEGIDDIVAQVPRVTLAVVTAEYDFYSRQLRLVDAAIQQANWTMELDIAENDVMQDFASSSIGIAAAAALAGKPAPAAAA